MHCTRRNQHHFYPRPPRGGRLPGTASLSCRKAFLSTPSARRATSAHLRASSSSSDFYPRPPRGGRRFPVPQPDSLTRISIHALREEGDFLLQLCNNIRGEFLSTPSARRATDFHRRAIYNYHNFYPRPPRGGRQTNMAATAAVKTFLSTPSARRATPHACTQGLSLQISIHALREEGDATSGGISSTLMYFYPRPPRGGRHSAFSTMHQTFYFYPRPPRGGRRGFCRGRRLGFQFLSTPSARRATRHEPGRDYRNRISIHALREEGDGPTTWDCFGGDKISIHALREEGDMPRPCTARERKPFLSTPSARRATTSSGPINRGRPFLSTPSARRATLGKTALTQYVSGFLSTPSARRATAFLLTTESRW